MRTDSCRENQHAGQGHHQVVEEEVCLVGLALCFHKSRGEVHDSQQVGQGVAGTNQELLGSAQLQYHVSQVVTVARQQLA